VSYIEQSEMGGVGPAEARAIIRQHQIVQGPDDSRSPETYVNETLLPAIAYNLAVEAQERAQKAAEVASSVGHAACPPAIGGRESSPWLRYFAFTGDRRKRDNQT